MNPNLVKLSLPNAKQQYRSTRKNSSDPTAGVGSLTPGFQHAKDDTFDGTAWIGITPFALTQLRLPLLPPIPGLESFLEVNLRTYVHHRGRPGIWFFSLDASKLIPTIAARLLFALPYFQAIMEFTQADNQFRFTTQRLGASTARLETQWQTGLRLRAPDTESLAFFLVERYCLFAGTGFKLRMTRVYHHPWILDEAIVLSHTSTLIKSLGLSEPETEPVAHFSRSLSVEIWPPTGVPV